MHKIVICDICILSFTRTAKSFQEVNNSKKIRTDNLQIYKRNLLVTATQLHEELEI